MKQKERGIFSVIGGDEDHQIDRKELQEKLTRMDLYFARVYKRLEELDVQLNQARQFEPENEAIIKKGIKLLKLKSEKESVR